MRLLIAFSVMALSSCALTPAEFRETGDRQDFVLKQTPTTAAACIARNLENSADGILFGNVQVLIKEGARPGLLELTVPTAMVAEIGPAKSGSQATLWTSRYLLGPIRDRYVGAFTGC
jgi:hypothetical protein